MGRGRAAPRHGAAEADHTAVQAPGHEEAVSSFAGTRRRSGCEGGPQQDRIWHAGQTVHQRHDFDVDQHPFSFRLRNRLELEALVEELSALVDKEALYGMYEESTPGRSTLSGTSTCWRQNSCWTAPRTPRSPWSPSSR